MKANQLILEEIESSNISRIGHSGETLAVVFKGGVLPYLYSGVDLPMFQALSDSESKGKFFNKYIKPNYECISLSVELPAEE